MIFSLLVLSVILGVFAGIYLGKQKNIAKGLLIFSAGFLLTVTVLDIFPEVYTSDKKYIGLFILAGVILQLILESLTKGFEHGHLHHQEDPVFPFALLIGIFIHAFIEGIPLARTLQVNQYLIGILLHNLPISFVFGSFLLNGHLKKTISWSIIILFALASPLGMIFGNYFNPDYLPYALALVSGIFLHISSVIIFESNKNHQMDWQKIFLVLAGIGLAATSRYYTI